MEIPELHGRLPANLAAAADAVIDSVLAVAARDVTATGTTVEKATRTAWGFVARDRPEVWALALLRLSETDNLEMLLLASLEEGE